MLKFIKVFTILCIVLLFFINFQSVYSLSDINMNNFSEEAVDNTQEQSQISTETDSTTPPASIGTVAEEGLGISGILNIFLITVGVVLILLGIAIIIKLK